MRRICAFSAAGLLLFVAPSIFAQDGAKKEANEAGKDAKNAAKDTGKAAKHTGKAIAKGTKKA
jgi:hypothetical protein